MKAAERQSLRDVTNRLTEVRQYAATLHSRIEGFWTRRKKPKLLEIGAAAGYLTIAMSELGYICTGLEPDPHALQTARELAEELNHPCLVIEGCAECLPFPDESFDIVITTSALELACDIDECFREIGRVVRPGGLFWFETASSMSPFQHEIRGFPFFGWYPDRLKEQIMWWAVKHRPDLVGYTQTPAVHWFSDRFANAKLEEAGFGCVIDRWHFRGEHEGGRLYRMALHLIRKHHSLTRLANVIIPECAYAAIKTGKNDVPA